IRWIDLGCPIDLDFDPKPPPLTLPSPPSLGGEGRVRGRGFGWMFDDQRPTLTLTSPRPGANAELSRVLLGMSDAGTGLDSRSFKVRADFAGGNEPAGKTLAGKFREVNQGVWELKLAKPITDLPKGKLTVSVKDKQGNVSRVERTFSVQGGKR